MSEDAYADHFEVTYTGPNPQLGDVGHGGEFGADLGDLYLAGRRNLPGIAAEYTRVAAVVEDVIPALEVQAGLCGAQGVRALVEVTAELQWALRNTAENVRDCGDALVHIAADYAATDQSAANEFNNTVPSRKWRYGAPDTSPLPTTSNPEGIPPLVLVDPAAPDAGVLDAVEW